LNCTVPGAIKPSSAPAEKRSTSNGHSRPSSSSASAKKSSTPSPVAPATTSGVSNNTASSSTGRAQSARILRSGSDGNNVPSGSASTTTSNTINNTGHTRNSSFPVGALSDKHHPYSHNNNSENTHNNMPAITTTRSQGDDVTPRLSISSLRHK